MATVQSPCLVMYHQEHPVTITLDCGATSSLIRLATAEQLNLQILQTVQKARIADGKTFLKICGEVHFVLNLSDLKCSMDALVVQDLDTEILAGTPFLEKNRITIDFASQLISIHGKAISYDLPCARRVNSQPSLPCAVLRSSRDHILLPGERAEFELPQSFQLLDEVAIQPVTNARHSWPAPDFLNVIDGRISIPNDTVHPVRISSNEHVAQIRSITSARSLPPDRLQSIPKDIQGSHQYRKNSSMDTGPHSREISLDPDRTLSDFDREQFESINLRYDMVFHPSIGCYNDASGRLRAGLQIGPTEPPHTKARLPNYNETRMKLLQDKMDQLEEMGVLARPEDVGVTIEYVSPSFLVGKAHGSNDGVPSIDNQRFVTAFGGVAQYAKRPPSCSQRSEQVLRFLAKWDYIIITDMTKQFFQMPVTKASMKYLGVLTPYKGLRVYTRAAMGMPGSTEHLDQLMRRILGDLMHEGSVSKIADDLYVGAKTMEGLLQAWERVLQQFQTNNLRLSAKKTVICPRSSVVLGWIWSKGSISPSPHKMNPLATADPPVTVKGLRTWLGAVKQMRDCVERLSSCLSLLEAAVGGKDSADRLQWTEELVSTFRNAQSRLREAKTIFIPRASDQLVIVTDGASQNSGIGAVLHLIREGKTLNGGYFSMKLRSHHLKWLPCEIEALAITAAVTYWAMYITEAQLPTQILTDSKPCIEAYGRLSRGQFSASARVATFLATMSRFRLTLQHIPGSKNLTADYLSRNPSECSEDRCQICQFVRSREDAIVGSVSVTDVIERRTAMPFTTPSTWKRAQQDCADLRRVYAHLTQGTEPSKKEKCTTVKHYLSSHVMISRDGLLVVKRNMAFAPNDKQIVVPAHLLEGLVTALHIRLSHPTKTQLERVFRRYFFALESKSAVEKVTGMCTHCASLATLPPERPDFTTSPPPTAPGYKFSSDVLRRERQFILVTRDAFSAYTTAVIIANEKSDTLRSALLETTAPLRSATGAVIRVDAATGVQALVNDRILASYNLTLEIGRFKNINKNPVAERAIQELEKELKKRFPQGGQITSSDLAETLHVLNSRIRSNGISAREIVFQRDYVSGQKLNLCDKDLADTLYTSRLNNHDASARSKVPKPRSGSSVDFKPGDVIFVKSDGSKHATRQMYIVCSVDSQFLQVRKFINNQIRSLLYKIKPSEAYKVPSASRPVITPRVSFRRDSFSSDSSDDVEVNLQAPVYNHSDEFVDDTDYLDRVPEPTEFHHSDNFDDRPEEAFTNSSSSNHSRNESCETTADDHSSYSLRPRQYVNYRV